LLTAVGLRVGRGLGLGLLVGGVTDCVLGKEVFSVLFFKGSRSFIIRSFFYLYFSGHTLKPSWGRRQ
jgi:hypothetical protein